MNPYDRIRMGITPSNAADALRAEGYAVDYLPKAFPGKDLWIVFRETGECGFDFVMSTTDPYILTELASEMAW